MSRIENKPLLARVARPYMMGHSQNQNWKHRARIANGTMEVISEGLICHINVLKARDETRKEQVGWGGMGWGSKSRNLHPWPGSPGATKGFRTMLGPGSPGWAAAKAKPM